MRLTSLERTTGSARLLTDVFQRPLRSLRLSVTDRCNLRCQYCMPEEDYVWLSRDTLLTYAEMTTLVSIFTDLGVDKVRLTGGEPLLRHDLPDLVARLTSNVQIIDLALTTNGVLLTDLASALYDAGLHRLTVSLDTLNPDRFQALTRRARTLHARVLEGIEVALGVGFTGVKLDTVVMRDQGIDLRRPLRAGATPEELASLIASGWQARQDRGAEERKALERAGRRETLVQLAGLRQDPHLEMHTRGG